MTPPDMYRSARPGHCKHAHRACVVYLHLHTVITRRPRTAPTDDGARSAARRPAVGGRRRRAVLVHVGIGLDRVVLRQVHLVLPQDLAEGEPVVRRRVAPPRQPRLVVLEDLQHVRVPDLPSGRVQKRQQDAIPR
jgi:hypothetical protein